MHQKKTARVSPCFLHLKPLKTALMGDIKLRSSRHRRYRYRRHRSSRSIEQGPLLVMVRKDEQDAEKRRVTLRSSFKVVLSSASCSWCDTNVDGKIESDEEAKKKQ
jgi:hypothetical protein